MAKAAAVAEPETIDVAPEPSETARSGGKRKLIMLAIPVALVGIIIGIPLGIVVGRVVWNAFATNLGAVPVSAVPGLTIVALAVGVLVVANALAVIPAVTSARRRSVGQLLRAQ